MIKVYSELPTIQVKLTFYMTGDRVVEKKLHITKMALKDAIKQLVNGDVLRVVATNKKGKVLFDTQKKDA